MKCDRCNKPAIVHQVIIKNGKHREIHLCASHAAEAGVPNPGQQPINKLMTKVGQPSPRSAMPTCPGCGTTLTQIRKDALFGCPECYDTFGRGTAIMVERSQGGAAHHVGRGPGGSEQDAARRFESRRLVEELDQAVRAEQYERAAEIKAKLAELAEPPSSGGAGS
ncbi:MAG: UvrB/UvrC motif-containing protein [Phycisphaerales bacterium]|nr:UvrB/UvrC motif-containing protein [Phycisphaerales bacterium]MDP7087107.1 UvrB/UvrC motif-containing protein [Phycisphaerales bacterium]MDP7189055.1 UvrB/UvrC motif-containing protein [Phycisphaerales bacterium]